MRVGAPTPIDRGVPRGLFRRLVVFQAVGVYATSDHRLFLFAFSNGVVIVYSRVQMGPPEHSIPPAVHGYDFRLL